MKGRMQLLAVLIGLALVFYGAGALASPPQLTVMGPDWRIIAVAAAGLFSAMTGAYARGLSGKVEKLEAAMLSLTTAIHNDRLAILREHHTKEEANHHFQRIEGKVDALHARFDKMHYPSVFSQGGH